jgi:hypothetical protein
VYYGSLVPHTLQAKSLVYQLSTAEALQIFMRTLLGEELARSNKLLSAVYALSLFLVAALSVPALLTEHNKQPRAPQLALPLALLLPALLVLIAYAAKRILLFPWYMPLLLTPAMLALLLSQRQRAGVVSRVSALLLLFLCCVPSLISLGQNFYALAGHPQYASDFLSSARVRRYLEIGKDLQAKAPSATLLAPEIGALGFAFSGKIVDAVGLVSPEALAFHPLAVPAQRSSGMLGAIPPELVQQVQPDYIVSMELFAEALLRSEQVSQYQIEKVSTFTEEDLLRAAGRRLWDGSELLVLSKNAH